MNHVSILIPGLPPTVNHQSGYGRGRVFKTTAAKKYQAMARVMAIKAMGDAGYSIFTGPCSVEIYYYFPDKRRRDAANYNKVLLDAFSGVIYQDDKQIADNSRYDPDFVVYDDLFKKIEIKLIDKQRPRVEVIIYWENE